jgi:hypothetical protein
VCIRIVGSVLLVLLLSACKSSDSGGDGGSCTTLFGSPNQYTGLGPDQCQPQCGCGPDAFVPPTYDAAFIQSLVDEWQIATPYPPLTANPYGGAPPPQDDPPGTVCAVVEQLGANTPPRPYTLVTYPSADAASAAGAKVTHFGHCGVCSTLANLAVYMRDTDLTAPVRACGIQSTADGGNADVACLQQLGFDLPCAQIWAYDTANTRSACLAPCIANITAPYNAPDGAINDCLQCDEDQSGPVFKAVAGRTRRNSGIPNAICRPCSEVQPLVHAY